MKTIFIEKGKDIADSLTIQNIKSNPLTKNLKPYVG